MVQADSVHAGELVDGSATWAHLADGQGFVHAGALQRI